MQRRPDDASGTSGARQMASLDGRERTEAEFARLLEASGLRLTRVVPTGTVPSVVEARVS
jgi:hypothetical protein